MIKHLRLIVLVTVGLLLSSCGGSNSNKTLVSVDADRPNFLKSKISRTVGFYPFGTIVELNPTFTWVGTDNATEYEIGHEDPKNPNTWTTHTTLSSTASCSNTANLNCSFKLPYTFVIGDHRAWWVRAKVGGIWNDWSFAHDFTVVKNTTPISVPQTILPTGIINKTNPSFVWTGVSNVNEYILGYEEINTDSSWVEIVLSSSAVLCQNLAQNCVFIPPSDTFKDGDNIAWYVRAKEANNLGDWSDVKLFTVEKATTPLGTPETISPVGSVDVTNPSFIWKGVANATEYQFGYEEQSIGSNWEELSLSLSEVNCQSLAQNCTFSLPAGTFKNGDSVAWYVRAVKANSLGDWSTGKYFSINVVPPVATNIIINEVLAANTHTNVDLDYIEFSDWIELYNPSSQDVDISNYGLSDDDNPIQWKIPNGTIIKAKDYLLVWADDRNSSNKALHTNFRLSSKGEKVTLADNLGDVIDSINFKKQNSDISVAKQSGNIVFMSPSPGEQNSSTHASKDRSENPDFSHAGGFYDNSIAVVLSQAKNAEVFYTTDGSIPDQTSNKYTHVINISETTIIRATALEASGLLSDIVSNTYFINHNSTLPVVSLVVDPAHLYDPKIGIYTAGDGTNGAIHQCDGSNNVLKNYVQEWERPADIEYFGANHVSQFTLRAGLSIAGECSRRNEKKGFSVELDKKFGFKSLDYKIYPDKDLGKLKDFKLRPGSFGFQISDILAAEIVRNGDLHLDYQSYKAIQMYVNGDYWGLYNFREKKGKDYITSNYPNIDKDDLDIIKNGYIVRAGDLVDYDALVAFVASKNNDLSNDADYQQVLTMIDEDNYIDYMSLMIYSSNVDWIDSNLRSWKEKKPTGKWRWMLDDLDSGFISSHVSQNWFTEVSNSSSSDAMIILFQSLTKNAMFRQKFKARLTVLLDTTLSTTNMLSMINTIIDERKDYLPLEPLIWDSISSTWINEYVQSLKDFSNQRTAIVRNQLDIFIP